MSWQTLDGRAEEEYAARERGRIGAAEGLLDPRRSPGRGMLGDKKVAGSEKGRVGLWEKATMSVRSEGGRIEARENRSSGSSSGRDVLQQSVEGWQEGGIEEGGPGGCGLVAG